MRRAAAVLAALLAVPAAAHETIEGDGKPTTERREVGPFDAVELESFADVTIRVGGERALSVTVDGNLQRHLRTEVRHGALVVDSDGSLHPRSRTRVEITVPALRRVELAGSGNVEIGGGAGPLRLAIGGSGNVRWSGEATELEASIEGSGNVRLEGRADRLSARVEGSGNVDAAKLRARDVAARIDGSGDVDVTVDGGALSAAVSGSGDVRWSGSAKVESVSVSGSGTVARKE